MGMYTELVMACELEKDTPQNVIDILHYMVDNYELYEEKPNDPLFDTERWEYMLRGDSYYFDGKTNSTFEYDDIAKAYFLTVRCNLKNYSSEIEKFLNWIEPFSVSKGFVGYSRYEEFDDPRLIYFDNGVIFK